MKSENMAKIIFESEGHEKQMDIWLWINIDLI